MPITETHTDPDGNQYDTIHVEFPYTEEEHIPKRGKVSVIAECCEFPEPIVKKEDPNAKKDKKKKVFGIACAALVWVIGNRWFALFVPSHRGKVILVRENGTESRSLSLR